MLGAPDNFPQTNPQMNSVTSPAPAMDGSTRLVTWLIVGLALFLRLLWLGMKPPHFDEGVNGWFIDQMSKLGYFQYDPSNYHGPFHFYALFLSQTLFGHNIEAMRLPLVLINTATVWLLLQYRRFLPWRACVFAALAFAVSPGMLFYSRYAIHESWVVFGMVLSFWGAAEMWMRGTARGLWAVVMGVTLMVLNKETHIIHLSAFALAVGTLGGLEWLNLTSSDTEIPRRPITQQWQWKTLADTLIVGLLLLAFFYSGGFLNPAPGGRLIKNFFMAFAVWSKTGVQGTDHVKTCYYWLQLMLRYEWPVLLGVLWSARALWPRMNRMARFLAIYGCGVLVAYSIVPYKTPWCIISIIWPFFFLFGCAVDSSIRFLEERRLPSLVAWLPGLAAVALLTASLGASIQLNYIRPTDPCEQQLPLPSRLKNIIPLPWQPAFILPSYVYVQTTNDYFKLTNPLDALVALDPTALHMPAHIILSSYHPLPWVLGNFTAVGYYEKDLPPVMDAGFILVEEDRVAKVEEQLTGSYFVWPFQLRDAMSGGKIYLNATRFAAVFPGRTPNFVPKPKNESEPVVPAIPVETPPAASPVQ